MVWSERLAHMYANQGIEIAVVGMTVVFVALAVIAVIIALLPHIIAQINRVIPEVSAVSVKPAVQKASSDESIAVALAFAHHQNIQK